MGTCKKFQQMIWLDLYEELPVTQKQELTRHLKTCLDCKLYQQNAAGTVKLLNQGMQLEPTEKELEHNRNELHRRLLFLKHQSFFQKIWQIMWQYLSLNFNPVFRLAVVVVLICAAAIGGWYLKKIPTNQGKLDIAAVDFIKYNPGSKDVLIKLKTYDEKIISGNLEQPEIQALLVQTLALSPRPNVRLKTVGALSMIKHVNKNILQALIHVIETDPNPGIRLKAIKLLNKLPVDSGVKELLINILTKVLFREKNSAIRNEAMNGLLRINDAEISSIILSTAEKDTSEYIRYKASQVIDHARLERVDKGSNQLFKK